MINEVSIKQAFLKVKEDISRLEAEISQNKAILEDLRNELKSLKSQLSQPKKEESSIGNQGVASLSHSLPHAQFTHSHPSLSHSETHEKGQNKASRAQKPLEDVFYSFTKKEFQMFLLIYQLEEESIRPTYGTLSNKLNLTSGATRSYISSIIKKGAPIRKKALKSKEVILSIDPEFKSFASRQKLVDLYYSQIDPQQTKLSASKPSLH